VVLMYDRSDRHLMLLLGSLDGYASKQVPGQGDDACVFREQWKGNITKGKVLRPSLANLC
jgi:hypothetical protein